MENLWLGKCHKGKFHIEFEYVTDWHKYFKPFFFYLSFVIIFVLQQKYILAINDRMAMGGRGLTESI